MKKVISLISLIILLIVNLNIFSSPALALLREHHSSPGVLRYHAQHSIQDRQQRAWQIILFPEERESQPTKYYLRLVGFPGLIEFIHPQSLEIITEGKILIAPDVFAEANPASNVGQYDVTEILSQLPAKGSVKLIFSLLTNDQTTQDISLKISPTMMTEWQWLNK